MYICVYIFNYVTMHVRMYMCAGMYVHMHLCSFVALFSERCIDAAKFSFKSGLHLRRRGVGSVVYTAKSQCKFSFFTTRTV